MKLNLDRNLSDWYILDAKICTYTTCSNTSQLLNMLKDKTMYTTYNKQRTYCNPYLTHKGDYLTLMDTLDTSVSFLSSMKVARWCTHVCWTLPLSPIAIVPLNWVGFSVLLKGWANWEQDFAFIVWVTSNISPSLVFWFTSSRVHFGVICLCSQWSNGNWYTSGGCCTCAQGLQLWFLMDVWQLGSPC